jgi:hypothetical protein
MALPLSWVLEGIGRYEYLMLKRPWWSRARRVAITCNGFNELLPKSLINVNLELRSNCGLGIPLILIIRPDQHCRTQLPEIGPTQTPSSSHPIPKAVPMSSEPNAVPGSPNIWGLERDDDLVDIFFGKPPKPGHGGPAKPTPKSFYEDAVNKCSSANLSGLQCNP